MLSYVKKYWRENLKNCRDVRDIREIRDFSTIPPVVIKIIQS